MKKLIVSIVAIFLISILAACTNNSTDSPDNKPKDEPKVGFTEKDVQKAVNDGDIVIEQTSDDVNAFYRHEPDAIRVYNLEKIFAFEDNVDEKGEETTNILVSYFLHLTQVGQPHCTAVKMKMVKRYLTCRWLMIIRNILTV